MNVTNRTLYNLLNEKSVSFHQREQVKCSILEFINRLNVNVIVELLEKKIHSFNNHLLSRWVKAQRNRCRFEKQNANWLGSSFLINDITGRGRPILDFKECSERSKRRKLSQKYGSTESSEISQALCRSYNLEGKYIQSSLIKAVNTTGGALEIAESLKKAEKFDNIAPYSAQEALALILKSKMSVETYKIQRTDLNKRTGVELYPSYDEVLKLKKKCYPFNCHVTTSGVSVSLQPLLNHTIERIVESITFSDEDEISYVSLICKYGCDGSGGYSEFMQKKMSEDTDSVQHSDSLNNKENLSAFDDINDTALVLFTVVPLSIRTDKSVDLWINPVPNSPRFCRPIRCIFKKETSQLVLREMELLENEIQHLENVIIRINGNDIPCQFELHCTMVDMKTINTLTYLNASSVCYLCLSRPVEMNQLSSPKHTDIIELHLQYGLTSLHAWLKMMEYVLHISYKLYWKKPTTHGATPAQRAALAKRKTMVCTELRSQLGLIIDRVVSGKGTSNTGNVARKFFQHHSDVAIITGIDHDCIFRLYIIMVALTCMLPLNVEAFQIYARETAARFVRLYPWYRMPVGVHKILIHGAQIASVMPLPPGYMSEEAAEASNKVYREVRQHHTRKDSYEHTSTDLFNFMCAYSDPVISLSQIKPRIKVPIPEEAKCLLLQWE